MSRLIKIIIGVVVVVAFIGVIVVWVMLGNDDEAPRTVTVTRREVVQDVSFTGRLTAVRQANLSPEVAGVVTSILVGVGEEVSAGDALFTLDTSTAELELAKAKADRASGQVNKQQVWQNAEQSWQDTKAANAETVSLKRQAVRDAKSELDQDRVVFRQTNQENGDDSSTTGTSRATTLAATSKHNAAKQALDESIKDAAKSDQAARSAADLALANYQATTQTSAHIAGLSSLEALEELSQDSLGKRTLVAPFSGILTAQDIEVGEYVAAGTAVITIQTTADVEISAQVPETDAVKLRLNLPATITFDAYPLTEQWAATITHTDPAASLIEGVPVFTVKLDINDSDDRLLPGLTANITVHAAKKSNVLAVPRRAVINRGTEQLVRVLESDGTITEQTVITGLAGSDGSIEIVSGLDEGQQIVTSSVQ